MALNANVGTAWISVVSDTAKIAPGIKKAIGDAEKNISGEGIGSKLSAGIGKTLKIGVGAAGVASGGILAASLTKGLGRLTGIENAQAKLAGLGHEAESVTSIMDDALASVKGTAFGLEDAATVAASAVAAGIKPGQELQRTLKLTGDAATIAGTDISSMGAIFNKVAASNKMQMDVANQLMDAGIPIMQMVADQMGVTAEEAVKMASDGKISFEIFQTALEEGLGGAALKSGETVQGAFANMGAAAGRFGAKLADPVFTAAPAIFTALGGSFDAVNTAITPATERIGAVLTPALESLASVIETRVTPWLGEMAGKAGDLAASGLEKALDPSNWEYVGAIFEKVSNVVRELWPSLRSLGESFLIIAQNISVATWTALAAALNAAAPLIESVLVPLVQKIAEFSEQNPGAIEAIVWAFLGFKAVGAVAGPVKAFTGTLSTLSGAVKGLSAASKGGGVASFILNLSGGAKSANPILAKLGGVATKVVQAFWKFAPALSKVGKVLGIAIRFVNPWVAGITAIVGALTWFFTKTETGQKIWGNFTDFLSRTWEKVTNQFGAIGEKFQPVLDWFGNIKNAWGELKDAFAGGDSGYGALSSLIGEGAAEWAVNLFDNIKIGWEELKAAFSGGDDGYGALSGIIGEGAAKFVIDLVAKIGTAWQWLKDTVSAVGDFLATVFEKIKNVAMITIGVIGTIVLTPFILAWNTWSAIIKAAWENIIRPVWEGISNGAKAMWENYIKPALEAIALGWQTMVDKISFAWNVVKTLVFMAWQSAVDQLKSRWDVVTTAISLAWQKLKDFFIPIWDLIKTLVFNAWMSVANTVSSHWNTITSAISAAWQALSTALNSAWLWIKANVFQAFMDTVSNLWNSYVSPILQYIGDKWNWLKDKFTEGWIWIRDNVFSKFESTVNIVKSAFEIAVEGISKAWVGLKARLAEPVNFIIKTIYTDGIRKAWGAVAGLVGLDELPKVEPIGGYAHGGILPGYTPGRDPYTFVEPTTGMTIGLSGGEAIMRPEATRALGSDWVDGVNAAARVGGTGGVKRYLGAFAGGGVIGSITSIVRDKFPGMSITSTLRPGDPGHHGTGNAVDFSDGTDSTPGMRAAAAYFAQNYGSSLLELIHSPFNQNIKNGQSVGDGFGFYGAGTMNAHRNHVHVASSSPLPGGGTGGVMGVLEGAVGWVGDQVKNIWDGIINSIPKFSGGGGLSAELPGAFLTKASGAAWDWIKSKVDTIGAFTGSVGAGVEQWRPMVESVLKSKGFSVDLADTVLRRMNQESGGNRQAINLWDSNAAAGIPSKGLMQVIDPTFAAYKDPGFNDIWDPEANLRASMNYAMSRYGSLPAAYNRAGGYADGGIIDFDLFDTGGVWKPGRVGLNLSGKNEYVFTNKSMQSFQQATESLQIVSRELSEAFTGGDYGSGELGSYIGREAADAIIQGVAKAGELSREKAPELRKSAEDYALGEARSALNLFGLGDAVDIAIGLGGKVQDVLNSDDVRNGVEEVKKVVLDPDGRYSGTEIEKKLSELGIEVEHLKSELGSSTIGGYIGMA